MDSTSSITAAEGADLDKEGLLRQAIYNRFEEGKRYSKKQIKEDLSVIYQDLGITSSKPKASDLAKYFNLLTVMFSEGGKRVNGFQIIKRWEEGQ